MITCPHCGKPFEEGTGAPSIKDSSIEICEESGGEGNQQIRSGI